MALLQGLLALVFRQMGKLLNTAFGWATTMLFGKVPDDRQIHLSVIAFGSVAWLAVLLGVAFPSVGTFLLAFVPLPEWVDRTWVRLAMLAAAVVIPLVVGVVAVLMLDKEQRPHGGEMVKAVLKGYPYTLGVALTLLTMMIFAPIMKVADLVKRWTTQHVPVIVEPDDYLPLVDSVQAALQRSGLRTERRRASWMLRLPTKILTALAGGAVERLVADKLTVLKAPTVEVMLHPSDMVIRGRKQDAARTRAMLAEHLAFSGAYLTWSKEANEIEDRLRAIWHAARERGERAAVNEHLERLAGIDRDMHKLEVPYEEWEVLFREKLLVERGLLQVAAGVTNRAEEPARDPHGRPEHVAPPSARRRLLPRLAALAGVAGLAWLGLNGRREH